MKKIIIFILIVTLVGGIEYFRINNDLASETESSLTPSSGASKPVKTRQMQTAEAYFKTYIECIKHPTKEVSGQLNVYCQTHNKYAGKELGENLEKQNAPVICGKNPPHSVNATRSTEINNTQALVILNENFGSKSLDVLYQVQQDGGDWKVANIVCP